MPHTRSEVPAHVRAAVNERDRYRCRMCGTGRLLHVHHINYRSEGVDHSPHNLILLCHHHHQVVHSNKRRWKPLLLAYIWTLYVDGRQTYLLQLERELNAAGSAEPSP